MRENSNLLELGVFQQMYLGSRPKAQTSSKSLIIAPVAAVFSEGWCRINSSIALPKLEAVSPRGSELRRRRIAGK